MKRRSMIGRFGCGDSRRRTGTSPLISDPYQHADIPSPLGSAPPRRMRSSTILLLTLRALSQETIKNLVLSGVGRLIVMDDQKVSELDLGSGLLLREEDGDVGKLVCLPSLLSVSRRKKKKTRNNGLMIVR
jgi:molybdopterin/thiamine biosynthesis adenylyltransferase